jgi:hypothetical protein
VAAGASGRLDENSLMLSLISQGGTKIDRWVDVTPTLDRATGDGPGTDHVEIVVDVRNDAPLDLPAYVGGPTRHRSEVGRGVDEGVYAGIVSFNLPAAATNIELEGDPPLVAGPDGPTQVIARRVELPRGGSTTVRVGFDVPSSLEMELVPSAKLPNTTWVIDDVEVQDVTSKLVPSH